ncbi:rhodanese domain protein [Candidatus Vecturithrix granuli]|uniref:Rhodanese domain protein n=1 Tax=Vecturithrix granuli TaxID=1499967 RepID=A0A0S6W9M6_VECG1|nr:rhodanese domain protein [Candidatus Vecturithrix granuli]
MKGQLKDQRKKRRYLFFFVLVVIGMGAIQVWQSAASNKDTSSSPPAEARFINLTPQEAHALIQEHNEDENFVILDVRTPAEFRSGKLGDAVNLDYYAPNFRAEMAKLAKNKTYLIYCRTSNRSSQTLRLMQELNFHQVYHLTGGIVGWSQEKLPVTP